MSDRTMQRRFTFIFGIVLAVAMGASLILPLLTQNINTAPTTPPTAVPEPTVPAPPDPANINYDQTYLHPSGLFTAPIPSGWTPSSNINTTAEAQVTMRNTDQQSVVEMRLIEPPEGVTSADNLSALFDDAWLRASWREYSSWEEDAREVRDDRLILDFTLRRGAQEYIARQVAYTDGEWVYTVRVVTPPNASAALVTILDELASRFDAVDVFGQTPVEWSSYWDSETQHIIRYPGTWALTDAAPGLPASIEGSGVTLRVETQSGNVADEAAAEAWVNAWRADADIVSVEATEQGGLQGFRVAYSLPSFDGPDQSGAAVLLNGADDTLHVANLRLDEAGVDLNAAPEDDLLAQEAATVLNTFYVLPDLSVSQFGAN